MTRPPRPTLSRLLAERGRAAEPPPSLPDGLRAIAEGLLRAAEAAEEVGGERRVEIGGSEGRVVFGVALRTADGAVQSFGHVPPALRAAGRAAGAVAPGPEARQPLVEVTETAAEVVVVAEVPGLDPAHLALAVEGGALTIEGAGAVRYRHRVALPAPVDAARRSHACRNGILEVRLPKLAPGQAGGGA